MITIIDYGMGNLFSILNMIRRVGGDAVISADTQTIQRASALILPGVGAFDNAMTKLQSLGMIDLINERVRNDKVPFMGVCLGMQLLFHSSQEGNKAGLSLLPGTVRRFDGQAFGERKLKIPHMGWNKVIPSPNQELFSGFHSDPRFYFVHSYHVVCDDPAHIAATCDYGYRFTCAIRHENIFAVQFHPEKSHRFGMTLFKNFIEQLPC
ncbi:imidazole glycerol phosphate synthase subunit HisH [Pusillimonas sp. SM2304]|uniref:imidazole glycerol phosphate synthase subunit HisH n=1 Tax=Pusillimonas sp. SM2304 TaxID=3073241 RepID=UPI0028766D0E|nr:imidazole glycerol phosphate synthase subunit HisH [Pusillimonas sp. SM2304]MDS1140044.1 imidazole glycerol phosphate synthase subunit HisH [Pusillimonas sp. SM2304]